MNELVQRYFRLILALVIALCPTALYAGELDAASRVITLGPQPADATAAHELIVIHTGDLHGYGIPRDIVLPGPDDHSGGLYSLATIIERLRTELWRENPRMAIDFAQRGYNDGILLLDAGDPISGTYHDAVSEGAYITKLMNATALDYDAATIGNHCIDYGEEAFYRNLEKRRFPTVLANAKDETTGNPIEGTLTHTVIEIGAIRVGLTGITHPRSTRIPGVSITDPAKALAKTIPLLRAKSDVVIVIAHVGLEREAKIAEGISSLCATNERPDLIVDSHSHANQTWLLSCGTPVVQAGYYGLHAGQVTIRLDPESLRPFEMITKRHDLRSAYTPPSAHMSRTFRDLETRIRQLDDEVVVDGLAGFYKRLTPRESPQLPNPAAEFTARSLVEGSSLAGLPRPDCAVVYYRSVRSPIAANDSGEVTMNLLHQVVPFDEKVVFIRRTGKQLRQLAERGLSRKYLWAGARLHIEEASSPTSKDEPPERTLVHFSIFDPSQNEFVPVSDEQTYTLAAVEFFSRVFVRPPSSDVSMTDLDNREALRLFLQKKSDRRGFFFHEADPLYPSLVIEAKH